MAFTVTGSATVSDVRDGVSPPTIYLTNENHTFVADADGIVADLTGFTTSVQAFVGSTAYQFQAGLSGNATGEFFRIHTPTVSGSNAANITVTVNQISGAITISDAGSSDAGFVDGTDVNEFTVSVPVVVGGFGATSFTRTISFSKSIGGNAPITRIESNTQTVEYDQSGTIARTAAVICEGRFFNNDSGDITWEYRLGATGAFTTLVGVSGVTFQMADGSTASDAAANRFFMTLTAAGYNTLLSTSRSITFRVTRGGQRDQITVARVNDGEAAVTVIVRTTTGTNILKQETDEVDLTADVYVAGTLNTDTTGRTYLWAKDGVDLTAITAGNTTTAGTAAGTGVIQPSAAFGFDQKSLRISGAGIVDNASSLFSVTVTQT